MGIFNKLYMRWQSLPLNEKIGLILDAVCGVGCSAVTTAAAKKWTEGSNLLTKVCVRTGMAGLGLAAGDISSKALKESYSEPLCEIIDGLKNKQKEEAAHE
jgi:hypothetical protein